MANTKTKVHIQYEGGTVSGSLMSVGISFAGRVLSLHRFSVRYARGGTLHAKVKRNGSGGPLLHAFTASVKERFGVFERLTKERFPLDRKFGPSTAHMMQNENVTDEMGKTIRETYDKRIEHEITRILSGYGR